jgi:hypothetical protein
MGENGNILLQISRVTFEVRTVVGLKNQVFWDAMWCDVTGLVVPDVLKICCAFRQF